MYLNATFLRRLPVRSHKTGRRIHFTVRQHTYLTTWKERCLFALKTKAYPVKRYVTPVVVHRPLLE